MSIKEKIDLLNKEISEKISDLKLVRAECENEETVHGELSLETSAKKELIESEWKKSISEFNKLQGSIKQ